MNILILGGTTEANRLCALTADQPGMHTTLSLAGRTRAPILPERTTHRIGGFGGAEGLATWLRENDIHALVDATHPFAKHMPFNAARAAELAHVPLLCLLRPKWRAQIDDHWLEVEDHAAAINALGTASKRVFLTVGRMEIAAYARAPQHRYIVRSVDAVADPKPLENAIWIEKRGPFTLEEERALLGEHAIDIVLAKNSGGSATEAKLLAARERGLKIILIKRPPRPEVLRVETPEDAMEWLRRIHESSA